MTNKNKTEAFTITLPTEEAIFAVITDTDESVIYIDQDGTAVAVIRRTATYGEGDSTRTEWRLGSESSWDVCPWHMAARVRRVIVRALLENEGLA